MNKFKTALSFILLVAVLIFSYIHSKKVENFNPYTYKINTGGSASSLNEIKKDKILLLYFGFLSCPVICPTTLGSMAAVFKDLTKEQQDKIAFVFIDLDPEKDTIARLLEYTHYFNPSFTPVSLSISDLSLMTKYFGASFKKVPLKSQMGYTIDHSTDIKVIMPNGEVLPSIKHGLPKKEVVARLTQLINDYYKR